MADLFPRPARATPRVLMHFVDVGHMDGAGDAARFVCRKCGHDAGWMPATLAEIRRGVPCPVCAPSHDAKGGE